MENVVLELTSKEVAVIYQALHEKVVRDLELGINKIPTSLQNTWSSQNKFTSDLSLKFLKLRKENNYTTVKDFDFPQLPIK
jgi:hypothetical protein